MLYLKFSGVICLKGSWNGLAVYFSHASRRKRKFVMVLCQYKRSKVNNILIGEMCIIFEKLTPVFMGLAANKSFFFFFFF